MLSEKIELDLKEAMKSKNTLKLDTLRMLKAAINNYLIEKKKLKAGDDEILGLIQKQAKLRQDSIEGFQKGGRQDLVEKEAREKAILEAYLPTPLTDQELAALVKKVVQETSAKTKADTGRVMKEVMAKAQGRADGRRINQIVSTILIA